MTPNTFKRFISSCRAVSLLPRRQRLPLLSRFYPNTGVENATLALGHPLPPKACVHHVNGDHSDHRYDNLVICQDAAYHQMIHTRTKQIRRGLKVAHEAKGWIGLYTA